MIINGCFVHYEKLGFSSTVLREEASDLHNFPPKHGGATMGGRGGRHASS